MVHQVDVRHIGQRRQSHDAHNLADGVDHQHRVADHLRSNVSRETAGACHYSQCEIERNVLVPRDATCYEKHKTCHLLLSGQTVSI